MKKRIISIVLCIVLLLALLPCTVSAAGGLVRITIDDGVGYYTLRNDNGYLHDFTESYENFFITAAWTIEPVAKEGYRIVSVKVNGSERNAVDGRLELIHGETDNIVEITTAPAKGNKIWDVDVLDLLPAVANTNTNDYPMPRVPAYVPCSVEYSEWFSDTDGHIVSSKIEAGKTYSHSVTLTAADGWYFDWGTVYRINGSTEDVDIVSSNGTSNRFVLWRNPSEAKSGATVKWYNHASDSKPSGSAPIILGTTYSPADPPFDVELTFGGWYTDRDLTIRFDAEEPIMSNTNLYARWLSESVRKLTSAELTGFVKPVAGQSPITKDDMKVPVGAEYDVSRLTWMEVENDKAKEFTGSAFVEGHTYYAFIGLSPYEGFYFNESGVSGKINGAPCETDAGIVSCFLISDKYVAKTASCPSKNFTDVPPESNWAHAGIDFCVERDLFSGVSKTTFEPNTPMNRAMLVTVLWRYEGKPMGYSCSFSDVKNGSWYADAVAWAASEGIVNGVGKGKFDPSAIVTREQMAAILYRYSEYKGFDISARADFSSFPDAGKVSSWAKTAMQWAVAEKLIGGSKENGKTYIQPKNGATRAQVAAILMRFVQNIAE